MSEQATTRERVLAMTLAGLNPREIAAVLGLSTQAVYHHLTRLRAAGELKEKAS